MKKETYIREFEVNSQTYTMFNIQQLATDGIAEIEITYDW